MDSKEHLETVTITKQEYFELKADQIELQLLEAGGVDNWEWFSESLYGADLDENLTTITEKFREEIFGNDTK